MKPLFLLLFLAACIGLCVWLRLSGAFRPGNAARYNLQNVSESHPDSPLRGKIIFCLGSSVTKGLASGGISFVDYLAKIDGCIMIKEAVSATTLADRGGRSYLKRLKRHPAVNQKIDCFLCQLSTNDATFQSELGQISNSFDPADFDVRTAVGGMEAVIAFAKKTWDCPIVFYTTARYDNPRYHKLVNQLVELTEKWDIEMIDLWHSSRVNSLTPEQTALYRNDGVHPTKAGYLEWWTPVFERQLSRILGEK